MGTTEILQELTKIARGDPEAAVESIVQYNPDGTTTRIAKKSVRDKIKALELLGKSQKLS